MRTSVIDWRKKPTTLTREKHANVEESPKAKLLDEKDPVINKRTIKRSVNVPDWKKEEAGNSKVYPSKNTMKICAIFMFPLGQKRNEPQSKFIEDHSLSKYLKDTCKIGIHGSEFNDSKEVYKATLTDIWVSDPWIINQPARPK